VASVAFGAAALVGLYALVSAYWVRVTRVTVALARLPDYWRGRTLALVSDIHLGNFRGPAFSRQVVSRIMGLQPECILVGGDMFDGVKLDLERAIAPWAALTAPSGVYFVGGNHDDYGGREPYFAALGRVGMRILDNARVDIHGLQLVGIHDRETHSAEEFGRILREAALDPGRASILLAHRPENLAVPEGAGISLQLSGHTHRGQFWPWTLVVRRVHGTYAYGLNRFGAMLVFTSSGAGTWGPPFRLGTRSEVVLIRLESA
jgi:predicted MPP superfamily phosphohydrolase